MAVYSPKISSYERSGNFVFGRGYYQYTLFDTEHLVLSILYQGDKVSSNISTVLRKLNTFEAHLVIYVSLTTQGSDSAVRH